MNTTRTKPRISVAAAGILAAAAMMLAACASPAAPSETPTAGSTAEAGVDLSGVTLRVALPAQRFTASWDFSDLELPYTVEVSTFDTGAAVLEALNTGSVDIANIGDLGFITAVVGGADLKAIGEWAGGLEFRRLIVPSGSTATSIDDLVGEKIAVTQNSLAHRFLLDAITTAGYAPEDFEFVYLNPADAITAFQRGDVAAWATWEPYASNAELTTGAKLIQFSDEPLVAYFASKSALVEDPASPEALAAADFVARWAEVFENERAERPAWDEELAAVVQLDQEVATQVVDNWQFTIKPIDAESRQAFDATAEFLVSVGIIDEAPAAEDYLDDYANPEVEAALDRLK